MVGTKLILSGWLTPPQSTCDAIYFCTFDVLKSMLWSTTAYWQFQLLMPLANLTQKTIVYNYALCWTNVLCTLVFLCACILKSTFDAPTSIHLMTWPIELLMPLANVTQNTIMWYNAKCWRSVLRISLVCACILKSTGTEGRRIG